MSSKKAWNKGLTKETHTSVAKISRTMRTRGLDNAAKWREQQRKAGVLPNGEPLQRNGDFAELLGFILGDGHIGAFPRTECLRLVASGDNPKSAERYANLIKNVFHKKPTVAYRSQENCINITLYQKDIARRLGLPLGSKRTYEFHIPRWIRNDTRLVCRLLRGLYEAEGVYAVHEATHTYKFIFSNRNQSLLDTVEQLVRGLGFHPHRTADKVQVSRRAEVEKLRKIVQYRDY